ncbi:MAG: hypothetical protein RL762_102 [Bacteroidota bacterium]|jgi:UDP-N-acetylglucosamine 2-epimerase (non-hydrolysing)
MKITIIAGARPNFMKIAPIIHELQGNKGIAFNLVHTGQHYDAKMSETFFEELGIPAPDTNLECGGGTQAEQTAAIMIAFEKYLLQHPTNLILVVGDVTSTMACSIVAKKMNIKVAHVEAGIRSGDISMPEEVNRIVTDSLSDYFFTTTTAAGENLKKNGIQDEKIFFVGNVMIDTLLAQMPKLKAPLIWSELNLSDKGYFVLTLHRPANVDAQAHLKDVLVQIAIGSQGLPIIFPMHPRTAKIFDELNLQIENLHIVEPLGYREFNYLVKHSKAVITDSGGITEETTVLGVPCITLRNNTERPETVEIGTNELIGTDPNAILPAFQKLWSGNWKKGSIPNLWDGKAAVRIVKQIANLYDI